MSCLSQNTIHSSFASPRSNYKLHTLLPCLAEIVKLGCPSPETRHPRLPLTADSVPWPLTSGPSTAPDMSTPLDAWEPGRCPCLTTGSGWERRRQPGWSQSQQEEGSGGRNSSRAGSTVPHPGSHTHATQSPGFVLGLLEGGALAPQSTLFQMSSCPVLAAQGPCRGLSCWPPPGQCILPALDRNMTSDSHISALPSDVSLVLCCF